MSMGKLVHTAGIEPADDERIEKLEAAGIEPASEDASARASTCVSCRGLFAPWSFNRQGIHETSSCFFSPVSPEQVNGLARGDRRPVSSPAGATGSDGLP
jgi:hypothetical protein